MALWNMAQLDPPNHELCEYPANDLQTVESFSDFITTLTTAADTVGTGHPVWNEIKMFKNLQLRLALKLPCDKFLHIFQRVGHCLQKIIMLGLSKLYLDLAAKFLSGLRNASETIFLPSRQQLEYVLIRTQATAKLLCETLGYTREAFCYLLQRLRVGHMLQNLLMACSAIARISVMFRALLLQVCSMYEYLKPWCEKLKCGNWNWGQDLDIPDNLWLWLNPDKPEFFSQNVLSEHSFLRKIFEKVANNNETTDSEIAMPPTEDCDDDCNIVENGEAAENNISETDLGEVVSRKQTLGEATSPKRVNSLLGQIPRAKCLESLWSVWKDINYSEDLSIQPPLSKRNIKRIDHMFCQLHKKISKINSKNLTIKKKKLRNAEAVSKVGNEIAKCLILKKLKQNLEEDVEVVAIGNPTIELKPTKKLMQLKKIFHHMYLMSHFTKQVKLCKHLKKIYKCGIADIRLLKQNGENELAKKLIFCTSKTMIKKYQKLKL